MNTNSPMRRLLDVLLAEHGGTEAFVQQRRDADPRVSWHRITLDILEATTAKDHPVVVTEQTLKNWFAPKAQAS